MTLINWDPEISESGGGMKMYDNKKFSGSNLIKDEIDTVKFDLFFDILH